MAESRSSPAAAPASAGRWRWRSRTPVPTSWSGHGGPGRSRRPPSWSGHGRRALAVPTDVTDSAQADRLVQKTLDEFGKLDILVEQRRHRSEHAGRKPFLEITDEEWRRGMDINLSGAFYCARAAARPMVEQKTRRDPEHRLGLGLPRWPRQLHVRLRQGRRRAVDPIAGDDAAAAQHPRRRDRAGVHRPDAARERRGACPSGRARQVHPGRADRAGRRDGAAGGACWSRTPAAT